MMKNKEKILILEEELKQLKDKVEKLETQPKETIIIRETITNPYPFQPYRPVPTWDYPLRCTYPTPCVPQWFNPNIITCDSTG